MRTKEINKEIASNMGEQLREGAEKLVLLILEKPWAVFTFGNLTLPISPYVFKALVGTVPASSAYLWWSMMWLLASLALWFEAIKRYFDRVFERLEELQGKLEDLDEYIKS